MKIDTKIKITKSPDSTIISNDEMLTYPIDDDYTVDFDDVINEIEIRLFADFGIALNYNVNFEITNEQEICDKLFDKSN